MKYWNTTKETIDRDVLEREQLENLKTVVERVYANVPFYHEKFQELGLSPVDIQSLEDIKRLPFTTKDDLRENYPYGLLAEPLKNITRFQISSGTTGKPVVDGYTQRDLDMWAECAARSLVCAGADQDSIIQNCYGYGLFTGGLGIHDGGHKLGASVIPVSSGNTQRQLMIMQDFDSTHLTCTPSYAQYLGESLQKAGIDPDSIALRAGVHGAEAWSENMRKDIETKLGIECFDIYGLSEIAGPGVAIECDKHQGLHIWEDFFYPEIIDPKTGEVLDDGEWGELVITTLTKEGMPLIRYRTRDITRLISEPCECGRTHKRIDRLHGRTDDMLIIRGVNVFPSQIEEALLKVEEIEPHYLIVVDRKDYLDTLEIQVELGQPSHLNTIGELEDIRKRIAHEISSITGLKANIVLVEPETIARSEGKAVRVLDKREI